MITLLRSSSDPCSKNFQDIWFPIVFLIVVTMHQHWLKCIVGALLLFVLSTCQSEPDQTDRNQPDVGQNSSTRYATCEMSPNLPLVEGMPQIYGRVLFRQGNPNGTVRVLLWFNGFPTGSGPQPRALHIHQYGNLMNGCGLTGSHFNPEGVTHPNHLGDLGNFVPQQGKIRAAFESEVTLFGHLSVLGRAVSIHQGRDDLGLGGNDGSLIHGNAGVVLSCCVIGITSPDLWSAHIAQIRGI
ncbi:uncharacterized protein [Syngnathus scovelli]|uniref:uncharacterized protein n=1 Tax=Syngnathus scovelli TaxID=161590 RepID=UPI0021107A5A|nr:extracellular superoxide dismutase [Cu-Zn]-like [Syngnathus scovelli]